MEECKLRAYENNQSDMSYACRIRVGEPEGKRPLERSAQEWENNVKMDTEKAICENVGWIQLAQVECNGGFHKGGKVLH
jgi:hypothetical protein